MVAFTGITETGIISLIVAFVLGLLIGFLLKNVVKVGIIILAIIILLIAIGALSPSTVENTLIHLGQSASQAESKFSTYLNLLPYNSIAFIIGFVLGLIKG
ncbi:hypothetical protein [Metallosphaera sp.]|uniref:hypothetical protein n=1 Tax=Metallosphaera sp. TaxID=2020860 RepID=UPI0031629A72